MLWLSCKSLCCQPSFPSTHSGVPKAVWQGHRTALRETAFYHHTISSSHLGNLTYLPPKAIPGLHTSVHVQDNKVVMKSADTAFTRWDLNNHQTTPKTFICFLEKHLLSASSRTGSYPSLPGQFLALAAPIFLLLPCLVSLPLLAHGSLERKVTVPRKGLVLH